MVESFSGRYQQMLLRRVVMGSGEELRSAPLALEKRHNNRYRYSKLRGRTPMKALAAPNAKLRFPAQDKAEHRTRKPETGKYHVVRLIRSDLKINIFGECFPVPPEAYLEYVVATIDIREQGLKPLLDGKQIAIFDYRMR